MAKVKTDGIWEALFNSKEVCLSEEAMNEEQRQINQEIFGETRENKTPWRCLGTQSLQKIKASKDFANNQYLSIYPISKEIH